MVFASDHYELLDFGEGRKLERFGAFVLDRPSPAADNTAPKYPALWTQASTRYEVAAPGEKGGWSHELTDPEITSENQWVVHYGQARLLMQQSASGNVGLYPEHATTWGWLADRVAARRRTEPTRKPRVLNLFAYTGGASLAAAFAGAEVTHVDSSGPTVAWAKRNAEASDATNLPIRWLVEDAIRLAQREVRRGNHYDGIIADPPTYGHGPKGKAFKFKEHLPELMAACSELVGVSESKQPAGGRFVLFSCHVPGFGHDQARATLADALPSSTHGEIESQPLQLRTRSGRTLAAGVAARWSEPSVD